MRHRLFNQSLKIGTFLSFLLEILVLSSIIISIIDLENISVAQPNWLLSWHGIFFIAFAYFSYGIIFHRKFFVRPVMDMAYAFRFMLLSKDDKLFIEGSPVLVLSKHDYLKSEDLMLRDCFIPSKENNKDYKKEFVYRSGYINIIHAREINCTKEYFLYDREIDMILDNEKVN